MIRIDTRIAKVNKYLKAGEKHKKQPMSEIVGISNVFASFTPGTYFLR